MTEGWADHVGDGFDRTAEREMLGLERVGVGHARFLLTQPLARFDSRLFGGTALAAAVALAEAETGRPAIWMSVQFIDAKTTLGDVFECTTEVLALGQSAAQVRVTARVDGREIFCAMGATARPKPGRVEAAFPPFPAVLTPEESPETYLPVPEHLKEMAKSWGRAIESRAALPVGEKVLGQRTNVWTRLPGYTATPAIQAFLADTVPVSIARASGRAGGGSSLDNTIRFGPTRATDWILLEMLPELASGGYGHGSVHLWSPDGELLGTASQSAALILFD